MAESDKPIEITSMPRASFIEDGTVVEIVLATKEGQNLTLSFATNDFDRFVGRAAQLVTGARNQTPASGGHLEVPTVRAVAAMANAPAGGGKVILSVRSDTDLPYHFALEPEEAEQLRPQLHRAARSAKKQASKTRH